jgi:hypothetical protein
MGILDSFCRLFELNIKTKRACQLQPENKHFTSTQEYPLPDEWKPIIEAVELTRQNMLISGAAGTGKSTLLREILRRRKKHYVVVAPTGLAALNVGGSTIHSFFKFPLEILLNRQTIGTKRLRGVFDTLIIDEISMVRRDLLGAIDTRLRDWFRSDLPFGGIQIVMIGDPYQLPPVVTTQDRRIFASLGITSFYFFDSKAFQNAIPWQHIQLTKVWRQKDDVRFIDFLHGVRVGRVTPPEQMDAIGLKILNNFNPTPTTTYTSLTYKNDAAASINHSVLEQIDSPESIYTAIFKGQFEELENDDQLPFEKRLILKPGARVICIKNNGNLINGDIGTVQKTGLEKIVVNFDRIGVTGVLPATWDKKAYRLEDGILQPKKIGEAQQFPLRLAWAMTVHKAQGQTLSEIFIDNLNHAFESGQAYVALSRCRSASGVALRNALGQDDIICDEHVKNFMHKILE